MNRNVEIGKFRGFGKRFVRIENAAGYDRSLRFGGDEADTWFGGLQVAVGAAGAFGEERKDAAIFERFKGALHGFDIRCSITVDGDGSDGGHPSSAKARFPQCFASEVGYDAKDVTA